MKLIRFNPRNQGACFGKAPADKLNAIDDYSDTKTLQSAVKCNRNENIESYSSIRPKAIPARYLFSASKSEDDFLQEEYIKICSRVPLPSDAIELLRYFRRTFTKDARRLMFVNDEPKPILVRQVLQKAKTETVELNYKLPDGTYVSESYMLIFETEQQFNRFVEDYKSDPSLNINIVAITNPKRWRVLIILPEIYPASIVANKMYNMAKKYNCSYDNRLFIDESDAKQYPEKYEKFPTDGRSLGFNLWGGAKPSC